MRGKKALIISIIALLLICIWAASFWQQTQAHDQRGSAYAGSVTCIKCHKDIYDAYLKTAHFGTTQAAGINNIHGSFASPHNVMSLANGQKIVMEKRDSGFYQAGYSDGTRTAAHRFDIAFGGVKAQTYLYWRGQQLYELPVSYFNVTKSWVNSPGYSPFHINFDRAIVARCLECHSSYLHEVPQQTLMKSTTLFDKNTMIYGIDCERCHGPAAQHVAFQTANPGEKKSKYIANFKLLTRQQKLDACAVCHSANTDNFEVTAFAFKPGDTLANFKTPDFFPKKIPIDQMDVHGNQNGLLATSKCFLMSNMDCTTCHDTHINQRNNVLLYAQKCVACHNTVSHNSCKMASQLGSALLTKCIDCHMPALASRAITMKGGTNEVVEPYLVRTHHIAIYPEETKKIMAYLSKNAIHKN